jgi:hypothetical protein
MLKLTVKQRMQCVIAILFLVATVYASVTGPEARYSSAPGESDCTVCHDTNSANSGGGSITIAGIPAIYQPGQQYTLTVTVQQANRSKYGFQLTAIDAANARAGTLTPLGGDTQINPVTGTGGRQYIQHTQAGTNPSTGNSRVWQIRWTAPTTDIGTVRFYASGNAANGNGTNQGDFIYTTVAYTESTTSNVTAAFAGTPIDGQTLNAGSVYRINWETTGKSNIASVELRLSTDDGATFPVIPSFQLIQSIADPNVLSYDWTIPNVTTSTARLRLQVINKGGNAVNIISGKFALQGNTNTPGPTITSAKFKGNKLDVFGTNFEIGSLIMVNDKEFATVNLDPPTEALRSKKAGKKTAAGATVEVKVKNLNGQISNGIEITKPLE